MSENITTLDVEVHCLQPRWVADEHSKYRLYLDGELLTERDWIWSQENYIQENMIVEFDQTASHTLSIDVIKTDPSYLTQLALRNLHINGQRRDNTNGLSDTLTFTLT